MRAAIWPKNTGSNDGVRSAHALLEAQTTLSNLISPTTTSLIVLRADLESARLSLEAARRQLAQVTIVAPFDGVVLEVKNRVGDTVTANAAVIVMANPQALEVQASLSERDFTVVEAGQTAELLFDARPEITATGHVTRLVPERLAGAVGTLSALPHVRSFAGRSGSRYVGGCVNCHLASGQCAASATRCGSRQTR